MYCYKCGKDIGENNRFCPFCGVEQKVKATKAKQPEEKQPKEKKPEVKQPEEKKSEAKQPKEKQSKAKQPVEKNAKKPKEKKKEKKEPGFFEKNPKIAIIVLACVIAACLAVIGLLLFLSNQNKEPVIPADNVSVLDFDADWDSSYYDEKCGSHKVDVIMLVRNGSDEDIAGLQFTMAKKSGEELTNALNPEEPFKAEGYVKSGQKGVMVGTVWTNERKKTDRLSVVGAYKYAGEEGYTVPEGKIIDATGINNDLYSIRIDNPNDVEICTTATIVCVVIKNNKIKDSDATGRIDTPVAANSKGNKIKKVFQDPGLMEKYKKYKVYAIDSTNYR